MNKIPDSIRPTCSCGEKMKYVEYEEYYDSFFRWECDKCGLEDEVENYNVDEFISRM